MALINCPECGKEVSDKAQSCIHCGYPLKKSKSAPSFTGMNICPKCGEVNRATECPLCATEMVDCHCTEEEFVDIMLQGDAVLNKWKKKLREQYTVDSSSYDENAYEQRKNKDEEYHKEQLQYMTQDELDSPTKINIANNVPKCPTCNSTNIEKISLGKKAFGGALFGLFSSDVRKTMHCNNCGYKW